MATEKVLCGECKKVTNHNLIAEHKVSGDAYDGEFQWETTYQIVQCMGCDAISFRRVYSSSTDYDPETGRPVVSETLYPDRTNGKTPMEAYDLFSMKTKRVYLETLKALNNQTPLLAAIGLRVLIESICLEQKTKSTNLANSIDELAALGLLSTMQAEFLHNHRFMGNEAAHEIVAPNPEHLVAAIDIAETLLKTIYILPGKAASMKPKNALTSA